MSIENTRRIIAGEIVASGNVAAHEVAERIMKRLAREGLFVVDASQTEAVEALKKLDCIFDFPTDEADVKVLAEQIGIEDPTALTVACLAVREVLDGPMIAEQVASYYRQPAAA
jgi:hypothetical protein